MPFASTTATTASPSSLAHRGARRCCAKRSKLVVRKTKAEAEHTRATLLDAAEQVFQRKGVAAATLNDVARAAGMTRGAIYWHFRDKAELLHAMCERATLPMELLLTECAATADSDPLGALRAILVQSLRQVATSQRQRTVFDILFHKCEVTGEMAPFFEREQRGRAEWQAQIRELLRAAVRGGQLPPECDVVLAHHAVHAYLIGLLHEWLAHADYDLATSAEALVDALLAGLRHAPPRFGAAHGA